MSYQCQRSKRVLTPVQLAPPQVYQPPPVFFSFRGSRLISRLQKMTTFQEYTTCFKVMKSFNHFIHCLPTSASNWWVLKKYPNWYMISRGFGNLFELKKIEHPVFSPRETSKRRSSSDATDISDASSGLGWIFRKNAFGRVMSLFSINISGRIFQRVTRGERDFTNFWSVFFQLIRCLFSSELTQWEAVSDASGPKVLSSV